MTLTKVTFSMVDADVFNVQDFGADPSGIIDCTVAIQAAVDAADAAGGGIIYFPAGTYLLVGKYTPIQNNSRLTDGVTLKSNIAIIGNGNQSIIKLDANCCYAFTGRFRNDVTPLTNLYNIQFRNLTFTMPVRPGTFFPEQLTLFIDSCENCVIDTCQFIGWSGDAIMLGGPISSDTSSFKNSIVKNITIQNCIFDGVDKDNRNCISITNGEYVEISNNLFKNSTRADMPGAIDVEPELASCLLRYISIHDNQFYNIGGGLGVVSLALGHALTYKAENFIIANNIFRNCTTATSFAVSGRPSANPLVVSSDSPSTILFTGNLVDASATQRHFSLRGCDYVTIDGNTFLNGRGQMYFGYPINGTAAPIQHLTITNNVFRNTYFISSNPYDGLIYILSTINSVVFSNNNFINCGRWSDATTPATMQLLQIDTTDGTNSSYLDISNNFVSSEGNAYSAVYPIFYASTLVHPTTITLRNNKYIGAYETGNLSSMYTLCVSSFTNGSASFYNLIAAPANPKEGDIYYDSTSHKPYCYNGTTWNALF